KAGQSDQMTKMTFDQAVEVPNHVLPAGTYWFKVMGNTNDAMKNVVEIYDARKTHLIAMVPAIPAQRKSPGYGTAAWNPSMDKTELRIAAGSGEHPAALLTWFYPFGYSGHQFYYRHNERERLREEGVRTVALNNSGHVRLSGN